MAASKLFNLLALVSVALLTLSTAPVSVNALVADRSHIPAARQIAGHDAVAQKRRNAGSLNKRCKSNPSTTPSQTPTTTPSITPVADQVSTPTPTPTTTTTTSSAAPAATSSSGSGATSGSKKWGLAWPNGDSSYLANFARPNVGYLYTWSPYLPSGLAELGLQGIPMLWGWDQVTDFQNLVVEGYANIVLGMNEPNEPSQSNLSPQDGATIWQTYINPLQSKGYKLVSPACTDDDAGLTWYKEFFQACSGCHFDAIAFHAYTTNAQDLINYATTLHDTYNLPIWVTEFADQNYSGTGGQASMSDVWTFATEVANFVNSTPWLEVAFPFGAMSDLQGVNTDNALLASNGYPTDLGYFYFDWVVFSARRFAVVDMVKQLPPVIKHLLTLRNPEAWPSPPIERLNGVLTRTLNEAKQRNAENGWLVLSTILSLTSLREALEDDVYAALRKHAIRDAKPHNIEATIERGTALWNSIYEPHAIKLYNKLKALHPDFITFIIQAYGTVLSPLPQGKLEQGNLTRALGSVVGIATLRAEGRVGPQLTSHVFGLLKARYEQDLNEEDKYLASDEGTEWVIRKVDEIVDAVTADEEGAPAKVKL
ncbi:hypothetical protein ID866_1220 [Astraeus odoratus]|nr:hypothetical protein ID866_1220 [Astraeus odoratus]